MPPTSETPELDRLHASHIRWAAVGQTLASQSGQQERELARLQECCVDQFRVIQDAFLLRNLQVVAAERIDYIRAAWSDGLTQKPTDLPDYRDNRYREVLSIANPIRPYHPHLAQSMAGSDELMTEIRRALRHGQLPEPEHRRMVADYRHGSRQTELAQSARIAPHESLGVLHSVVDLLAAVNRLSPYASANTRNLEHNLAAAHAKLSQRFIEGLHALMDDSSAAALSKTADIAQAYQSPGLLRAHLRHELLTKTGRIGSERELLEATDASWSAFHLVAKQIAWFAALGNTSEAETKELKVQILSAHHALAQIAPDPIVGLVVQSGTAGFAQQLTVAMEQRPFLDLHRETLTASGKIFAGAALTFAFGHGGAIAGFLGKTDFARRALARTIATLQEQLRMCPLSDGTFRKALTQIEGLGSGPTSILTRQLKDLLTDRLHGKWKLLLQKASSLHYRRQMAQGPHQKALRKEQIRAQSAVQAFEHLAAEVQQSAWIKLLESKHGVLAAIAPRLKLLTEFLADCLEVQRSMHLTPTGPGADPRLSLLSELRAAAHGEAELNRLQGFDRLSASKPERFLRCRHAAIAAIANAAYIDAVQLQAGTLGRRALSQILVGHDPSPLDQQTYALLNLEDADARRASGITLPDLAIGRHVHPVLMPSYHVRESALKLLFPDGPPGSARREERAVAVKVGELCRSQAGIERIGKQITAISSPRILTVTGDHEPTRPEHRPSKSLPASPTAAHSGPQA